MNNRQIIWEHYQNPKYRIDDLITVRKQNGTGCQDFVKLIFEFENHKIKNSNFIAEGCILVIAAADIFCEWIKNKNYFDYQRLKINCSAMLKSEEYQLELLKPFDVFLNLQKQIGRHECLLKVFQAADLQWKKQDE